MAKMSKHSDQPPTAIAATSSPGKLELRIPSDPATLRDVRQKLESFAARSGGDQGCCNDLGLCVNEALANIMRHAYHGATDRPIVVEAEDVGGRVSVRIRDWGDAFDPAMLKHREYNPLEPGGLGVICMRKLLDDVTYVKQEDGGMVTTLSRHKRG